MEPKFVKRKTIWHLKYKGPEGKPTTISTGCTEKAQAKVWAKEFLGELDSQRTSCWFLTCWMRGR